MKLIQFTDFHLRLTPAPEKQFHVEPFWRGESREMFARIGKVSHDADAICFTGDAAHGGGKQEVALFFDLLAEAAADKPVFMVVGNHDVVDPEWQDHFRRGVEKYKNFRLYDGVYPLGEIDVVLINNEYLTRENLPSVSWRDDCFPVPAMSTPHWEDLHVALSANNDRPALVMVHCPSHVLPATLFDFGPSVLPGQNRYQDRLNELLDRHPRVGVVLAGHVHFNSTQIFTHGRIHQSLASITEYPCAVRIVEITGGHWHSHLDSLAKEDEIEADVKFGKAPATAVDEPDELVCHNHHEGPGEAHSH